MPGGGIIAHVQGGDPAAVALLPDQGPLVRLERKAGSRTSLPYMLEYLRRERDGAVRESLFWIPLYRAEGRLKLPGCEVGLSVFDFNGDGVFDVKDSRRASTLGIDVNNDGQISGAGEYRKMSEIIDICGQPLTVAALDPSASSITFEVSDLKAPQVNNPVPSFSVTTTEGRLLRPELQRGKILLLDFWALWCAPCVAKLSVVEQLAREHRQDLVVFGINVDEAERCAAATRMVEEKSLSFQQVMRCQGESDFLWRMFGSMQGAHLAIPLYVLVDRQGVISYAGHGGEGLLDLRGALRSLLDKP